MRYSRYGRKMYVNEGGTYFHPTDKGQVEIN